MQVQLHHIAGREGVLRQIGEEQFVDDARACHPNRAFLLSCGMRGHNHAAGGLFGSHRNARTIVEAAHHLAFWTLLDLIRWQVQTRLNERVIEEAIVLAAGHKREPSKIGEYGSIAILPIQPQQRARSFEVICRQISANGRESFAQFFPVSSIPTVPKRTEPVVTMSLRNDCSRPNNLPAFTAPLARCTDVV